MNSDDDKTVKEVEDDLETLREQADALGKKLDEAEDKHPAKPDHASDGGVF